MENDLVVFDFYGDAKNLTNVSFTDISINYIPLKEFFDANRVGFVDANTKITSPTFNVSLSKKIYKTDDGISNEKLVNDFFIHYFVYPDMPLEFSIVSGTSPNEILKVHGFLEDIRFSQNIGDPFYTMDIKVLAYR